MKRRVVKNYWRTELKNLCPSDLSGAKYRKIAVRRQSWRTYGYFAIFSVFSGSSNPHWSVFKNEEAKNYKSQIFRERSLENEPEWIETTILQNQKIYLWKSCVEDLLLVLRCSKCCCSQSTLQSIESTNICAQYLRERFPFWPDRLSVRLMGKIEQIFAMVTKVLLQKMIFRYIGASSQESKSVFIKFPKTASFDRLARHTGRRSLSKRLLIRKYSGISAPHKRQQDAKKIYCHYLWAVYSKRFAHITTGRKSIRITCSWGKYSATQLKNLSTLCYTKLELYMHDDE